jgi:ribosome biogenesis GTPase A
MPIGWYPGHMHKARKDITLAIAKVDVILELVDARLPYASENPLLAKLIGDKPRLRILNKADLADPLVSKQWAEWHAEQQIPCLFFDKDDQVGLATLLQRSSRGFTRHTQRANRLLIVGIPNVGKSTLINLLAGRKLAKVGNEPAVTKARQEIQLNDDLVLIDTPGILWPKLEDQAAAARLAASGAIRNTAIDLGEIGLFAVQLLQQRYPTALTSRYGLDSVDHTPLHLLETIGRKRGCLVRGGVDFTKAGEAVLNDLRSGKLGRISLEQPADIPATPYPDPTEAYPA